jgi:hypothetical protein
MAPRLFSLQGLAIQAVVEASLAARFFPEYLPSNNTFAWAILRFLVLNYVLYIGYWGIINPYFVSPIRHFPSPKVCYAMTVE